MSVTIYHNPRCTKSRETLKLLEERGIRPRIVEYLKTPPSAAELKRIIKMLGIGPRALLRAKEPEYKKAKLENQALGDDKIIAAMVKNPILIERPIVIKGARAALGRPPANVLKILAAAARPKPTRRAPSRAPHGRSGNPSGAGSRPGSRGSRRAAAPAD